jgi:hypothetical protein
LVVEFGPPCFSLAWIDVAARSTVLYAVQGRWPQHDLKVSMPLCPERTWLCTKNRAVIEARPGRDNVPPRDAAKEDIRPTSGGCFSVPFERRAGGPHAVQDDGKLAGDAKDPPIDR